MANRVAELIFIPSPGVGHIMATIELAKLLVNRDQRLFITILVIKPPGLDSGQAIDPYIETLAKNTINDHMSLIQLPQDETPSIHDPEAPFTSAYEYIKSHGKYVRNVVVDLKSQLGSGRVVGFVVDMFCTSMIDVANEFNIPTYMFFTSNAGFLGFISYTQTLGDELNEDVIELSNSDTEVLIPCFIKPVPTKVFWSPVKTRKGLDFVLKFVRELKQVKAIMVNTFLELETHTLESLYTDASIPPVYPVGPILNLEGHLGSRKTYDDDVIRWLDRQPPSSVVFLCFGSLGSFDEIQVKEIARGLEKSGHRFVWSLRRSPPDQTSRVPGEYEDPSEVLPEGFMERTCEIGKVIGWAPQTAVLAHDAVGGFVSHCGWNSILESLWFGVSLAAWSVYAEQQINAFEMVVELGLAVEIKLDYMKDFYFPKANSSIVTAKEIESGIRRVMEDNKVRAKVKEMSEKSRSAVAEDGSSYTSIGLFIQEFVGENS